MNNTYQANYGAHWEVGDRVYLSGYAKDSYKINYPKQCQAPPPLTVLMVEKSSFTGNETVRVMDSEGTCFGSLLWSSIWFHRWEE